MLFAPYKEKPSLTKIKKKYNALLGKKSEEEQLIMSVKYAIYYYCLTEQKQ